MRQDCRLGQMTSATISPRVLDILKLVFARSSGDWNFLRRQNDHQDDPRCLLIRVNVYSIEDWIIDRAILRVFIF